MWIKKIKVTLVKIKITIIKIIIIKIIKIKNFKFLIGMEFESSQENIESSIDSVSMSLLDDDDIIILKHQIN